MSGVGVAGCVRASPPRSGALPLRGLVDLRRLVERAVPHDRQQFVRILQDLSIGESIAVHQNQIG